MNIENNTMGEPMLKAVNLTKRYSDGLLALDHVNFSVLAGQVFAMLGGNGAGKTTAINLFLNLIEPTDGEAIINGYVSHRDPLKAKGQVSFVSENVMLYSNFTAIQNLEFFAQLGGRTELGRDDYRDVLRRVGLADEAHDKRLKGFSKGMRQKCGIAIAIIKDSPAILLDEPTSGLDPRAGHDFIQLLATLRAEGKAILMSTHDVFRAREIADVVAIMDRGRIVMQESASDLGSHSLEELYMQHIGGRETQVSL